MYNTYIFTGTFEDGGKIDTANELLGLAAYHSDPHHLTNLELETLKHWHRRNELETCQFTSECSPWHLNLLLGTSEVRGFLEKVR
jgi:hypothetical protein